MINLVMILIGMLMDDISGIILCGSLLLPLAEGAGMDPIHFAAATSELAKELILDQPTTLPKNIVRALSPGRAIQQKYSNTLPSK